MTDAEAEFIARAEKVQAHAKMLEERAASLIEYMERLEAMLLAMKAERDELLAQANIVRADNTRLSALVGVLQEQLDKARLGLAFAKHGDSA